MPSCGNRPSSRAMRAAKRCHLTLRIHRTDQSCITANAKSEVMGVTADVLHALRERGLSTLVKCN